MPTTAYKVFTHDLRPPVRGGDPVWSGALPYALPRVAADSSDQPCAAGWNACASAEDALRISGFCPDGRPSRLFKVQTSEPVISRGDKLRAATWTITEEISADDAIRALSRTWFREAADEMANEQLAWRVALARPAYDPKAVEQALLMALDVRGLPWTLKRFVAAEAILDARAACVSTDRRVAWAGLDGWAAWDAADDLDARNAWTAWNSVVAWAVRIAWNSGVAWRALACYYASLRGWIAIRPEKYTLGIRDAFVAGLAIVLPTGPNQLGWAMV